MCVCPVLCSFSALGAGLLTTLWHDDTTTTSGSLVESLAVSLRGRLLPPPLLLLEASDRRVAELSAEAPVVTGEAMGGSGSAC